MTPLVRPVQIVLLLPAADFSAYAKAARRLARQMGSSAPNAQGLMLHTLLCRDVRGLTEDYLESIHWPIARPVRNGTDMIRRRQRLGRTRLLPIHKVATTTTR